MRKGRIVVAGEFGPALASTLPDFEITVLPGETHITGDVRDEAELLGVVELVRDLGASLISFSIDRSEARE